MTTTPTPQPEQQAVVKTWKPTTAGILSIIAGVFSVIVGATGIVTSGMMGPMMGFPGLWVFAPSLIATGIVAIVGGVFALQRRVWGMALAGAICALFPNYGFLPVVVLGILAIIFISLSKQEFD